MRRPPPHPLPESGAARARTRARPRSARARAWGIGMALPCRSAWLDTIGQRQDGALVRARGVALVEYGKARRGRSRRRGAVKRNSVISLTLFWHS